MKSILKALSYGIALALVVLPATCELLLRRVAGRDVLFYTHSQILSVVPGKLGWYLRNAYYHLTLRRCPLNCCLDFGVLFTHSEAEIGDRVYVGARCTIGMAVIGDETMLADGVQLLSGKNQHGTSDPTRPFQEQDRKFEIIRVGNNCWIGTNAVVMADVGSDSIIGAGSVVTNTVPSNTIAVGSPAQPIRNTFTKL